MSPPPTNGRKRKSNAAEGEAATAADAQPSARRSERQRKVPAVFDPSQQRATRQPQTSSNTSVAVSKPAAADSRPQKVAKKMKPSAAATPPQSPMAAGLVPDDCSLCHQLDEHLPSLSCKQCKVERVHVDCLADTSAFHAESEEVGWLCAKCITCAVCYEPGFVDPLFTCFGCHRHKHAACNSDVLGRTAQLGHIYRRQRIRCAQCRHLGVGHKRELLYWLRDRQQKRRQMPTALAVDASTSANLQLSDRIRQFAGYTAMRVAQQSAEARSIFAALLPPTPSPTTGSPSSERNEAAFDDEDDDEDEVAEMQRDRSMPWFSEAAVPDCRDWSKQQVREYLCRYLEASVVQPLLDDEVDGAALMQLTRKEVLQLPGDGRLLELWAHVLRLQRRSNRYDLA